MIFKRIEEILTLSIASLQVILIPYLPLFKQFRLLFIYIGYWKIIAFMHVGYLNSNQNLLITESMNQGVWDYLFNTKHWVSPCLKRWKFSVNPRLLEASDRTLSGITSLLFTILSAWSKLFFHFPNQEPQITVYSRTKSRAKCLH